MEALSKDLVEERALPCLTVAEVWRMRCVSKEWQDLIESSRFASSWISRQQQKPETAVPAVLAFTTGREIFKSSPFKNMDRFDESFEWVKIATCPFDWGMLEAGAGGLLFFRRGKNYLSVVNPLTGQRRMLPMVDFFGRYDSFYMAMSQDSREYTICCVTSGCGMWKSHPSDGSTVHVYKSGLDEWKSMSMPPGWLHFSNTGELVGNSTFYQLFYREDNNNQGLFVFNLETLSFELTQTWPEYDKRLDFPGNFLLCHARSNIMCCTNFQHPDSILAHSTGVWDMGGSVQRLVKGAYRAIHFKGAVLFVAFFASALLDLHTGQSTGIISPGIKACVHCLVAFSACLYSSP